MKKKINEVLQFNAVRIHPVEIEPGQLEYALLDTEVGIIMVVGTSAGIYYLGFAAVNANAALSLDPVLREVKKLWPGTAVRENKSVAALLLPPDGIIHVYLKGTPFQLNVWRSLAGVKSGERISYSELALRAGNANATRAVASAVAANPVSIVIPCHRIIRKNGDIGKYHWGRLCKEKLLDAELKKDCHTLF
ncbi:MAG: methylated-DNA--[protein]-cysteine S-methyltransferase [Bacteroidales bacterium]